MFLFSRRRRHTRFAIVTGCQMWALPIFKKADDYKAWLAWALDEMDGCDILVPISSAGGGMGSEKYWHNAFEVDVMGPVRAVEAVIPGMTEKGSGSIVLIATTSAAEAMGEIGRAHV